MQSYSKLNSSKSDNEDEGNPGRRTLNVARSASRRASRTRSTKKFFSATEAVDESESVVVGIRVRPLTEGERKDPRNKNPK